MSAHLVCPLIAILLLLLLLAVPNIRLVYQVYLSFFLSITRLYGCTLHEKVL